RPALRGLAAQRGRPGHPDPPHRRLNNSRRADLNNSCNDCPTAGAQPASGTKGARMSLWLILIIVGVVMLIIGVAVEAAQVLSCGGVAVLVISLIVSLAGRGRSRVCPGDRRGPAPGGAPPPRSPAGPACRALCRPAGVRAPRREVHRLGGWWPRNHD